MADPPQPPRTTRWCAKPDLSRGGWAYPKPAWWTGKRPKSARATTEGWTAAEINEGDPHFASLRIEIYQGTRSMVGRSLAVNLTEEEARYLHEQLALMLSDTPTP